MTASPMKNSPRGHPRFTVARPGWLPNSETQVYACKEEVA